MKRQTFAMKINKGKTVDFRRNLGEIWSELTVFLDERGMTNFSIWSVENIIFGYYETDDNFAFTAEDRERVAVWEGRCSDVYTWISVPFENMRLMYHDFGIVRESKELIRHRVFVTKLVPGTEEEY